MREPLTKFKLKQRELGVLEGNSLSDCYDKRDVKLAVELLEQLLKGQCEYEDVENKKYIHNDKTIRNIINEVFPDLKLKNL